MKWLSIVCLIYLLAGIPGVARQINAEGVESAVGIAYALCIIMAIGGVVTALRSLNSVSRVLLLWAVGIPSLVYFTNTMSLAYPVPFHLPLAFGSTYSDGRFTKFGVDFAPGLLFVLVWVVGDWSLPGGRSNKNRVKAETADG